MNRHGLIVVDIPIVGRDDADLLREVRDWEDDLGPIVSAMNDGESIRLSFERKRPMQGIALASSLSVLLWLVFVLVLL